MSEPAHLSNRAVIRLSGDDRRSFLQGLISQDVESLTENQAIFATLLTPQGKILFDFFVIEDSDALLIDCHATTAESLLKRLTLYKLRAAVSLALEPDLSVLAAQEPMSETGAVVYRDPRLDALGWRAVSLHKAADGVADYDARRMALGVPECERDFAADDIFLLDVNYDALNAVNYKKGCFVGQEVTSRMKRKGSVRKRTLIATFDGAAPAKGAPISAGESTIGEILSAVDGVALALIRLDRWEKAQEAQSSPICEERPLQLTVPDYLKQN